MKTLRRSALALCASLALPHPAHAQLGGLIKKKVADAVKAPEQSKNAAKQQDRADRKGPEFNERVVRITEPVLKGFLKGKRLEVAQLTDFKNRLLQYRTEEDYDACKRGIALTPEGQKIAMQITTLPPNATMEQMQGINEKMNQDMNALVARKCGASILAEWPDYNRQQRITEIHENGAEAAGLLLYLDEQGRPAKGGSDASLPAGFAHDRAPREYDNSLLEGNEVAFGFESARLQQGGQQQQNQQSSTNKSKNKKSTEPYDIVDERLRAWCQMKKLTGYEPSPGDTVAFTADKLDPKASPKFVWRFEPQEWKLLEILGCPELEFTTGPIQMLELLMDEIKIVGRPPIRLKR